MTANGDNITVPGERELDDRLNDLAKTYHTLGDAFYKVPPANRDALYFGKDKDKQSRQG